MTARHGRINGIARVACAVAAAVWAGCFRRPMRSFRVCDPEGNLVQFFGK